MKRILTIFLILICSGSCCQRTDRTRIFASPEEIASVRKAPKSSLQRQLFEEIRERASQRAEYPGLMDPSATSQWWHHVSEYMTDAALVHLIKPSRKIDKWLHDNTMDIARLPVTDWAGPAFRNYKIGGRGYLETAHLCWAVSICLDFAEDLFTKDEVHEIRQALREKGLVLCRRYIDQCDWVSNWNCIMLSGYAMAAAVLEDREALEFALSQYPVIMDHFEADGSFGESLQYGNYAYYGTMFLHEALVRTGMMERGSMEPYGRFADWAAEAMFNPRKDLSWWPVPMGLPRTANFGDCASTFRPSGDLLMHIASHAKESLPEQAGLASWLFEQTYLPLQKESIHDLASFGFINDFGFFSVLFAAERAEAKSPQEAGLSLARAFSAGDAFLRDSWEGHTIIAYRMPAEPRHAIEHLHEDINSMIVSYDGEQMLTDPGHSCYRNACRKSDVATASHNTCTFTLDNGQVLSQKVNEHRWITIDGDYHKCKELVRMGGERLECKSEGDIRIVASDAADFYGSPIESFRRSVILCGSNVVFVVDYVKATGPVKTSWNWLMDNRDGNLSFHLDGEELCARRGSVGMAVRRFGSPSRLSGPVKALVHDAYHPLPGQFCEGRPGSGMAFGYTDNEAYKESFTVHIICLDEYDSIEDWELSCSDGIFSARNIKKNQSWNLEADSYKEFRIL